MKKYECNVCGYIYDPAENNNVKFKYLSEDCTYLECYESKDVFNSVD